MIFDCESKNEILDSFSIIAQKPPKEIEKWIAESKQTIEIYNWDLITEPFERILLKDFYRNFPDSYNKISSFNQIAWFHGTRCKLNSDFKDGILPLNEMVERIWDDLYSLISSELSFEKWMEFRKHKMSGHYAFLYHLKTKSKIHWGPFAMLVKPILFIPKNVGNHDYLKIPEIIEDIIICFNSLYPKIKLEEKFLQNSRPCIVKFITPITDWNFLEPALNYLYHEINGLNHSYSSNTCYDGKGKRIPKELITEIEFH